MRVLFTANYNHRWPSRAVTAFKAGWEGTIHRDAGAAAVAKGVATEVPRPAKAAIDGDDENGRTDTVDSGDHRPAVSGRARGDGRRSRRNSGDAGSASHSDQALGDLS